MARVIVPLTVFTRDGSAVPDAVTGDPVEGHEVDNDGRTGLVVTNVGATDAHNVTFNLFGTVDGQAAVPRVVSVAAGMSSAFGPFRTADYGSTLTVDVDSAELTFRAYRL